jgi:uncharacterized protein involved in exopolysaccharide biosynthesis
MESSFTKQEIHISEYFRVISRRRTLVLVTLAISVSVMLFLSFFSDPVYEATTRLLIEGQDAAPPVINTETKYESFQSQLVGLNTHLELIKSDPVISRVIDTLNLDDDKHARDLEVGFSQKIFATAKANAARIFRLVNQDLTPQEKRQSLIVNIKDKIDIRLVRDTRLVTISVRDRYPERAASIANTIAEKYISFDMDKKMEATARQLEWMQNELYRVKQKLEDEERKFFDFKQEEKIFSLKGKQDIKEQKVREFNEEYLKVKNERQHLDAVIEELRQHQKRSDQIVNVSSLTNNVTLEKLYNTIVDLTVELNGLSNVYRAKHPIIIQKTTTLEKSKKRFAEEIAKELDNLESRRAMLLASEKQLLKSIEDFEKEALDNSSKELDYIMLQRRVDENRNLYDTLMARIRESDLLKSSDASNLRIVMPAEVPVSPVSPKKKKNLVLGVVAGLMIGFMLAFFSEYMDRSIRTEEELQACLGLPVLSVIPRAEVINRDGGGS